MNRVGFFVLLVAAPIFAGAIAEDFDGKRTMVCTALEGHDCLPDQTSCKPLTPKSGKEPKLTIDVANKTVQSPYRTTLLPILHVGNNKKSLVLQGTSLELVWSATVDRMNGRLTVAIADREGAYVVFGQCGVLVNATQSRSATSK